MVSGASDSRNTPLLGTRPVVNAAAFLTRLGGTAFPEEVITAMSAAARCSLDMEELIEASSKELAFLTQNDAAYVTCGAAAPFTRHPRLCHPPRC